MNIKFQYKDYADNGKEKETTLSHIEFARRYEQHILPRRFVKFVMRYFIPSIKIDILAKSCIIY